MDKQRKREREKGRELSIMNNLLLPQQLESTYVRALIHVGCVHYSGHLYAMVVASSDGHRV